MAPALWTGDFELLWVRLRYLFFVVLPNQKKNIPPISDLFAGTIVGCRSLCNYLQVCIPSGNNWGRKLWPTFGQFMWCSWQSLNQSFDSHLNLRISNWKSCAQNSNNNKSSKSQYLFWCWIYLCLCNLCGRYCKMVVFMMQLFESILYHSIGIYEPSEKRRNSCVCKQKIQIWLRVFPCGAIVGSILKGTVSTPIFALSR